MKTKVTLELCIHLIVLNIEEKLISNGSTYIVLTYLINVKCGSIEHLPLKRIRD